MGLFGVHRGRHNKVFSLWVYTFLNSRYRQLPPLGAYKIRKKGLKTQAIRVHSCKTSLSFPQKVQKKGKTTNTFHGFYRLRRGNIAVKSILGFSLRRLKAAIFREAGRAPSLFVFVFLFCFFAEQPIKGAA